MKNKKWQSSKLILSSKLPSVFAEGNPLGFLAWKPNIDQ